MRFRSRRLGLAVVAAAMFAAALPVGPVAATGTGTDGCTPGYWKNHPSNWPGYTEPSESILVPGTLAKDVFYAKDASDAFVAYAGSGGSLLAGLDGGGGSTLGGAQRILLRAAIAAFLNAADDRLGYPLTREDVWYNGQLLSSGLRTRVNEVLATGTRAQLLAFAAELDWYNNLGCPL